MTHYERGEDRGAKVGVPSGCRQRASVCVHQEAAEAPAIRRTHHVRTAGHREDSRRGAEGGQAERRGPAGLRCHGRTGQQLGRPYAQPADEGASRLRYEEK